MGRTDSTDDRKHCKIYNFTCGLIYGFDLIVNCDKLVSDLRRLVVCYLYSTCEVRLNYLFLKVALVAWYSW